MSDIAAVAAAVLALEASHNGMHSTDEAIASRATRLAAWVARVAPVIDALATHRDELIRLARLGQELIHFTAAGGQVSCIDRIQDRMTALDAAYRAATENP